MTVVRGDYETEQGLAGRIARDLGADVVALDQPARMVELTRARGIDASVGSVESLPFPAGTFDCVYAGWMLYHVKDVPRGLAEIARVLRPAGRLVAVTNSATEHLRELRELLGLPARSETPFSAENGEELLRASFRSVERRDAYGWIDFPARADVESYVASSRGLWPDAVLPDDFDGPLRVRRAPTVFVADR